MSVGQGAHSDHVRHIARHADAHGVWTTVAGGGHHHDACFPGAHHRLVERVIPITGAHRGTERQVHNPDIVLVFVVNDPLDPGDNLGVAALALFVQHLDRDDHRVGCHAVILAIVVTFLVAGHRGHQRAVAVLVVLAIFAAQRAPAFLEASLVVAGILLDLLVLLDAAVQDGDADTSPGVTCRPNRGGVDRLKGLRHVHRG